MKIGIIREGKTPPDSRVVLSPAQCRLAEDQFGVKIRVQRSPNRCFSDAEFEAAGIELADEIADCDLILGVKEVPISMLIPGKTWMFFSHTIKKQAYNRGLLQAILAKNIRLIDYETLTNSTGARLIAFGFYAGAVGAHNGFWTFGQRTGLFSLPRMKDCHDYEEVLDFYQKLALPPLKIVLTGTGRVAAGAISVLADLKIRLVTPAEFLENEFDEPVYTQLRAVDYVEHRDGRPFDKAHFYAHGDEYLSKFDPFARRADLFLNGIFYDQRAPKFFSVEEMARPDFRIQVIADISCDLMPNSSVPSTIRATTVADPVYGFDPKTGLETPPFQPDSIDMMTIDYLPNELPRDASVFFGDQFLKNILPELLKNEGESDVIERGTIAKNGRLTARFDYLADFAED